MKVTGNLLISFVLLVIIASLYRIMPGRPWGFAPQIAMCLFGGAVIKDKKLAFLLPLLSMFISDALYELLYVNGVGNIPGFYEGQITNYLLFGSMTIFGFFITRLNVTRILLAAISAPTAFFILSNFLVWIGGGGFHRPKTLNGLIMCYADASPFYAWSVAASVVFSAILFGGYALLTRRSEAVVTA
ncbi:hypothetical protein BH09BAC2_BH09BAC2_11580 [soil metagenome]